MPKNKFWRIKNQVNGNKEILLYGPIADEKSWFGDEATPKEFASDLEGLGGAPVTVRINSGGGDVFAAHAIYNLLSSYKGKVHVAIDGLAASAATIVALAGDTISMASNALMMIHNPKLGLNDYYEAADLQRYLDALTVVKDSIIAAYSKKAKVSAKELATLMDNETWMGPKEALAKGFIDEITANKAKTILDGNMLFINSIAVDLSNFQCPEDVKNKIKKGEDNMPKNQLEKAVNSFLKVFQETSAAAPVENDVSAGTTTTVNVTESQKNMNNDAVQNAVANERQRILDLDGMSDGTTTVDALIAEAKKAGKTVAEVKPYIDAVKNSGREKTVVDPAQKLVSDMVEDNKASGVENIKGSAKSGNNSDEESAKAINAMAEKMTNIWGGKK